MASSGCMPFLTITANGDQRAWLASDFAKVTRFDRAAIRRAAVAGGRVVVVAAFRFYV